MSVNKKTIYILIVSTLFLCIILSSCSTAPASSDSIISAATPSPTVQATHTPFVSPEPTPTMEPYTSIVIGSVGDIMVHEMMLKDAQRMGEGDYNFTKEGDEIYSFDHWFEYIAPSLEYADLMIGNLETTIAVDNSLVAGYPYFATPKELLPALQNAGFDVLVNGNNHMLDKGAEGVFATVNALDEVGIHHTGAWTSLEDKNTPLVVDVQGIKVGIVSATCSVNEMDLDLSEQQKQYIYLKTDNLNEVAQQIANCKNYGAEVIVVCPHWGYEFLGGPIITVTQLAEDYIKMGADIILGHHPHMLHTVDNVSVTLDDGTTREGVVYYSLGNFISNQMGNMELLASAIAYVQVTRDNSTGEITIDSTSYLPIWCYIEYDNETDSKTYSILPVGQIMDNPEMFEGIDAHSIRVPLKEAWDLAIERLGYHTADPLRYVVNN